MQWTRRENLPVKQTRNGTETTLTFDYRLPAQVRREMVSDEGFHCQMCGVSVGEMDENTGGAAEFRADWVPDNGLSFGSKFRELRVLCSTCYRGARRITARRPTAIWLLSQIRRAGIHEQRSAYEWLHRKFGAK